jgi:hypothetical protein
MAFRATVARIDICASEFKPPLYAKIAWRLSAKSRFDTGKRRVS